MADPTAPPRSLNEALAFTTDPALAHAARELAVAARWDGLRGDGNVTWGEYKKSGREPYRTGISVRPGEAPAFSCSCPSRKLPCKHALGLLLLLVDQPEVFAVAEPPEWVRAWWAKRQASGSGPGMEKDKARDEIADPAAQKKRATERANKISAGLDELSLWLVDLVRHGLAAVAGAPGTGTATGDGLRTFDERAARLVDAQAPGAARMVREIGSIPLSGEGWPARMLEGLGRLYLLSRGWAHRETLAADEQADLRQAIGYAQSQEELRARTGVRDIWRVVGQRTDEAEDERFVSQRTWLQGRDGNFALHLQFAPGRQAFPIALVPGTALDAELVYFPSAVPLRAVVKERFGGPAPFVALVPHEPHEPQAPAALSLATLDGDATIAAALSGYARALGKNPWHVRHPMALASVVPVRRPHDSAWHIRDSDGRSLPIEVPIEAAWRLLALSGGHPLALFGEWNGTKLLVLGAVAEGRYLAL